MKRLIAFTVAIAAAFLLAGCGGSNDNDDGQAQGTAGSSSPTAQAAHNQADVKFAQGMIPHHRQAVQMAEMALRQASNQDVKNLASQIKAAQDPEIEKMSGWLTAWGEKVPADTGNMDHTGIDMPGMMSQQEMNELTAARGRDFDRMFLTMMIDHHEGAIQMARDIQATGENADVKALAKQIESAQTAEITHIQELLTTI